MGHRLVSCEINFIRLLFTPSPVASSVLHSLWIHSNGRCEFIEMLSIDSNNFCEFIQILCDRFLTINGQVQMFFLNSFICSLWINSNALFEFIQVLSMNYQFDRCLTINCHIQMLSVNSNTRCEFIQLPSINLFKCSLWIVSLIDA
jgi:hypothetical protein